MFIDHINDINKIGVYAMVNLCDGPGTAYIGSTSNSFKARLHHHRSLLNRRCHGNEHLQRAYDKYGGDAFFFYILEVVSSADFVIDREQHWLNQFRDTGPVYNFGIVAASPRLGCKLSEEHKRKIGDARRGKKMPRGAVEEMRKRLRGYKHTEEACHNMSKAHLGHAISEETKAKISKSLMGHSVSDKTRQIWSKQRRGRKLSKEHKRKISIAHKGKTPSKKCIEASVAAKAMSYPALIHDETGDIILAGVNLSALCREHGLSRSCMRAVISKKTRGHKGWVLL